MKIRNKILINLLVLLVIVQPVLVFASDMEGFHDKVIESESLLFKVTKEISLDSEVSILEGALIYGYQENESVHIQYKKNLIEIDNDYVEHITEIEEPAIPEFIAHDDTVQPEQLNQEVLFGYSMTNGETLYLSSEVELMVVNKEEYDFVLIGNVPHYLNQESFEEAITVSDSESDMSEKAEETELDTKQNSDSIEIIDSDKVEANHYTEGVETSEGNEDLEIENEIENYQEIEADILEEVQEVESIKVASIPMKDKKDERNAIQQQTFDIKSFSDSDKFFLANKDLPVYDNRSGSLVKVGELKKGQVYPRYESSPSWHRIQLGDYKAFVRKEGTEPASGSTIGNLNKTYSNLNKYLIAKSDLNVYDNSSGNLVPFGTIKKGQKFSIAHDYGGAWIYVIYADRVGFIKTENIQRQYFLESEKYFKVLENGLSIYDNRSGKLVKVGELTKGEVYPRAGGSPKWHGINYNGYTAYVESNKTTPASRDEIKNLNNNKYKNQLRTVVSNQDIDVYDNSSGSLKPFAKISKGQKYSIARDYGGDWIYIVLADRIGFIRSSDITKSFIPSDKYFKVIEDNTPIYDNRSGKLVKIGELVKGQEYKRGVGSPSWQAIDLGHFNGYVSTKQTAPSNGRQISNPSKTKNSIGHLVPKIKIPIYDNSGKGNMKAFAFLEKGTKYDVIREYNSWYEINLGGRSGFVKLADVDAKIGVRIFLDAGHGGKDPGGSGYGLQEKTVVLDIARKTANFLRSNYSNVFVEMSRTTDRYLSLRERSLMANRSGADYLVSLHTNAWLGKGQGFESFIYNGTVSQETRDRQVDIHDYLADRIPVVDRGKKRANFHMVRETTMPSLLLEYMFIDNKRENDMLRNASYRTTLAKLTAEAIAKSFNLPRK